VQHTTLNLPTHTTNKTNEARSPYNYILTSK